MVFRHISDDLKERALWLDEQDFELIRPHIPGAAEDDVEWLTGTSERSLRRWRANMREHGSVNPPASLPRGRPPKMHPDVIEDLVALNLESPELYLDEILDWLAVAHDQAISRSRLNEILAECNVTYKLMQRAAAERDDDVRDSWATAVQEQYLASQCLWIDETSKDDRTIYRHYGRSLAGTRAVQSANFVRGERYSLVAALSVDGYVAARVVPGSLDGEEFLDFMLNDVVCESLCYQMMLRIY